MIKEEVVDIARHHAGRHPRLLASKLLGAQFFILVEGAVFAPSDTIVWRHPWAFTIDLHIYS